jgi:A/G-specific adenine glycosylase
VWLSEIILQQTRVEQGTAYYHAFVENYPDVHALASASEDEVLKTWEGLGYYRRARNLQRLAQEVMTQHGGVFPREHAVILELPGVGPYTAGAVASFAFGLAEPIVDGNIARVLSRIYNDATPVDSTAGTKLLWERSKALVQTTDDPRALNSALMELGQTHCTPTKPACDLCPVRAHCRAIDPETLPVKQSRQQITAVTERVIFLRTKAGVLLELETGKRRTGLWKLPALHPMHEDQPPPVLLRMQYGITRYKVTLWVHEPHEQAGVWPDTHRVIPFAELESTPMPAPYRKALNDLLQRGEFRLSA